MEAQQGVIVWTDGSRADLVRRVMGRMGTLRMVALGGFDKGSLSDLATENDLRVQDDLRKMIIDHPAMPLLILTPIGVGPTELKLLRESKVMILALEPVDTMETLDARFCPSLRQSPAWLSAADPVEAIGVINSIQISSFGPRSCISLYAHLHAVMEMLLHHLGTPLSIAAALSGGQTETPEELAGMAGDLTAHLKFSSGSAAVIHLSDQHPAWERRIQILGSNACLGLEDTAYRLTDSDGNVLDELRTTGEQVDPAELIARQWRRILDGASSPGAVDFAAIRSCCQATLLSCRTGQIESPRTLLRMRT